MRLVARTRTLTEVGESNEGMGCEVEMAIGDSDEIGTVGSPNLSQRRASMDKLFRERERELSNKLRENGNFMKTVRASYKIHLAGYKARLENQWNPQAQTQWIPSPTSSMESGYTQFWGRLTFGKPKNN